MRKLIYSFLSFFLFFVCIFHAARELSLGCFEGYAEQEWIDEFEVHDAKVS